MTTIVQSAVDALRQGKTLLYPTDTIWGIGCDARLSQAVEKLYRIKQRDHSKSMLILCTKEVLAEEYKNLVSWLLEPTERPTTYILPAAVWQPLLPCGVATNLPAADGSLGIRLPRHAFCQQVINALGAPLVSSSANLSGEPSPRSYEDISMQLRSRVDFCVPMCPEFATGESTGSRIIKVNSDGSRTVIRP